MIAPIDPFAATATIDAALPLRTERLVVRRFTLDDLDAYRAYRHDAETMRYIWRPLLTEAQLQDRLAATPGFTGDGGWYGLAVEADSVLVGETIVKLTDPAARQAEIGWILAPGHRGKGYATEAGAAALSLAWAIGAHRVVAVLDHDNPASARVAEKLGMHREALFIDDGVNPATGAYGSSEIWAIRREH